MIKELEIENFKSVKHLKLPCRRINIFIGEPNTGKSNILEALGVLSFIYYGEGRNLKDFVRMERLPDLFHNEDIEKPIRIKADEKIFEMKMEQGSFHCVLNGRRHASFYSDGHPDFCLSPSEMPPFKFYRFAVKERFPKKEMEELLPPFGENLSMLLLTRREIRNRISPIIENFGLKLMFRKLEEDKIELLRSLEEGVFISLPYFLLSDTLQRFIFHFAVQDSSDRLFQVVDDEGLYEFFGWNGLGLLAHSGAKGFDESRDIRKRPFEGQAQCALSFSPTDGQPPVAGQSGERLSSACIFRKPIFVLVVHVQSAGQFTPFESQVDGAAPCIDTGLESQGPFLLRLFWGGAAQVHGPTQGRDFVGDQSPVEGLLRRSGLPRLFQLR